MPLSQATATATYLPLPRKHWSSTSRPGKSGIACALISQAPPCLGHPRQNRAHCKNRTSTETNVVKENWRRKQGQRRWSIFYLNKDCAANVERELSARARLSLGPGTNFLFIPIIGPLSHPPSPQSQLLASSAAMPSIEQMGNKRAGGREGEGEGEEERAPSRLTELNRDSDRTGFISLT